MFINLICWVGIGLAVGFIISKFVNEHGDDPKLAIILAAVGAAIGGFIAGNLSAAGISEFNGKSLWAAVAGALAVVTAWHSFRAIRARA